MRISIVCIYLLLQASAVLAQLAEHFDNDTVPWKGTDSAWQIDAGRLRSHFLYADSSFYISDSCLLSGALSWQWWIWQDFNTSSRNFCDVYLGADTANLLLATVKGYFVRIGDTNDEVCLYRKDPGRPPLLLINGRDGITNHSYSKLNIKVSRDDNNKWSLWVDGVLEGVVADSTYRRSTHIGIVVQQSTPSFFGKHYFDDFVIRSLDTVITPPPDTLTQPPLDTLAQPPSDTLTYRARPYDVLFHEILPRSRPSAGLLPARFIELRNVSGHTLQLGGWHLSNHNINTVLPSLLLPPDSLLLLCDKSSAVLLNGLGISNFPAPADSDLLTLRDDSGVVIHAVNYDKSWYGNSGKEKGGWSLEMISVNQPCSGRGNWAPALAPAGGTPGRYNSDSLLTPGPVALQSVSAVAAQTVRIQFDGAVDSVLTGYALLPDIPIVQISAQPPLYNNIYVQLSAPLRDDTLYTLVLNNISDCMGQDITPDHVYTFALPAPPDSGSIFINEVLYDPPADVPEFVEIYNTGKKAVNLSRLSFIRKRSDIPASLPDGLLLPGAYAAFTVDPEALCMQYNCMNRPDIYRMNLPALTNGEGDIILLYESQVLDSCHYTDALQLTLADNTKGVSLERLSTALPASDPGNWHSAAATAGFATPGYRNSQRLPENELPGELSISPTVFSPDNDGTDDVALVKYRLPEPGYLGNFFIFDTRGRVVRVLAQRLLLGMEGLLTWDGRGAEETGVYILLAEVFNARGAVKRWKLPVVLTRKRY